jgi:colicin import membrane protein
MKIAIFAFLLAMLGGSVGAQTGSQPAHNIDAQRGAINAERTRLEAGFFTQDVACYKKFAVNSCLGDVNMRRREAMAALRRQEILLNDEERKAKGTEQIRKTEEKSSPEKLQEAADSRNKAVQDYQERLAREKVKQQDRTASRSNEKAARDASAERILRNQRKIQARAEMQAAGVEEAKKFNERQKQAQAHRAQHEADQLKRDKPSAKPLPLPE